jgi:hypothetical protein
MEHKSVPYDEFGWLVGWFGWSLTMQTKICSGEYEQRKKKICNEGRRCALSKDAIEKPGISRRKGKASRRPPVAKKKAAKL